MSEFEIILHRASAWKDLLVVDGHFEGFFVLRGHAVCGLAIHEA